MDKKQIKLVRTCIGAFSIGISGLLYIFAGIAFLVWGQEVPTYIKLVILIYTGLMTLTGLLGCFSHFSFSRFIQSFAPITMGLILVYYSSQFSKLYTFFLGFYMLFIALVKLIDYFILRANQAPEKNLVLFNVIVIVVLSAPLFFEAQFHIGRAFLFTGIFCIFYGFTNLGDFLVEILPIKQTNRFKSRIRVNLPILFTALLPKKTIGYINGLLAVDADGVLEEESFKEDEKADLEVLIHVTEEGFGTMGHGDICYKGRVYCYGNYDHLSGKLFGTIGDGVLFTVEDRDQYIRFCAKSTGDSIFAFGLKLTNQQKEAVQQSLDELFSHVQPWKPCMQKYEENNQLFDKVPDDYASQLYQATRAKMYKFKETNFKTYFVLTTNCVKLADRIIRSTGIAAANPNGILSPGGYYDYFDRQYRLKNSLVISKQTYHHQAEIVHEKK